MDDSLHARGKALEDQFFREKDRKLLEKLRAEITAEKLRDALAATTGITDSAVLDALLENNVTAESLTSISLIPLVAVAWADGSMDDKERAAIMQATEGAGISPDSTSYDLVASWLENKPSSELLDSWKDYVGALKGILDGAAQSQLKSTVINRAKCVAHSAGGFLGIAKTSQAESKVIQELEDTLA